jgi:hypothetical protein
MKLDYEILSKYWHVASIIFSLILSLVYFVIENKNAYKTIQQLAESNKILLEKVSKLEGHKEGVDNVVRMFMENPPGQLDYRLKQLENKVFGNNNNIIVEPPKPPTF